MLEQKPTIKVELAKLDPPKDEKGRERKQSPVVEFANGDYYRRFEAKNSPFEVIGKSHTDKDSRGNERTVVDMTPEEEAAMLVNSGHFVRVKESEPEAVATGSVEASAQSGTDAPAPVKGNIGGAPASDQE
jgi:hypothetical protein